MAAAYRAARDDLASPATTCCHLTELFSGRSAVRAPRASMTPVRNRRRPRSCSCSCRHDARGGSSRSRRPVSRARVRHAGWPTSVPTRRPCAGGLEHGVAGVDPATASPSTTGRLWPRPHRASKEGQPRLVLRHASATTGTTSSAQLDADHRPRPGYLGSDGAAVRRRACRLRLGAEHLRREPRTPGWTVRGRLYREATLHGPVQAGCNDGWAARCASGPTTPCAPPPSAPSAGSAPSSPRTSRPTLWLQAGGLGRRLRHRRGGARRRSGVGRRDAPAGGAVVAEPRHRPDAVGAAQAADGAAAGGAATRRSRSCFYLVLGLQFVAATVLPVAAC